MIHRDANFSVPVEVTNPGQFLACCGLLELAARLWPGAEGWFGAKGTLFNIRASSDGPCALNYIVEALTQVGIEGELSGEERAELEELELLKRTLAKERRELSKEDEERRSSLGKRRREGALALGDPFNLRIAWWQEEGDDVPKTFAGRQEVLRMALAMLPQLPEAVQYNRPFDHRCLLQAVEEAQGADEGNASVSKTKRQQNKDSKVEPFYFDARRFAHALDAGFSLDVQEKTMRASAAPLTELLGLIGLQRFRPQHSSEWKWSFEYWTWPLPLCAPVAAGVACGAVPISGREGYRFSLRFRDDQKRYKAFGFATQIGGDT